MAVQLGENNYKEIIMNVDVETRDSLLEYVKLWSQTSFNPLTPPPPPPPNILFTIYLSSKSIGPKLLMIFIQQKYTGIC